VDLVGKIASVGQLRRGLFLPAPRRPLAFRSETRPAVARQNDRAPQPRGQSDRQTAETAWSEAFYAAAIRSSGIVRPSIIDSEFLERLR
ncbi:MAG: hypothetical protein WCE61_09655, partial [Candidatus Acidiferrum sp.]